MTQKREPKSRTLIKDLPEEEKELSKEEQKKVKGGNLIVESANARGGSGGSNFDGSGKDFIER